VRWFTNIEAGEDAMGMDKDRVKGSAEQAKGKVKEWAGKVTGDSKTEAEGKSDQFKGKVQNTVGGIKDSLRGK
jgi:uncharacterized protein YjbJ (UPF0337 family)